ncbi:MAG: tRNA uridine-5-carboxymethylaminomethyl(34) synthesis GTPase MnmE [Verrucomicrobiales bacterium]|nr:tRNA uridine-5-carboxymethylaminomethyl(34) synthesis GTPase MnmE [Verrucomicrobiales bacterium]
MTQDTIAAISTALGEAAVSIVRLSGSDALAVAQRVLETRMALASMPPRTAVLATARDADGRVLDRGLVIHFPAPRSYTGETVIEFHGHGGMLVTQAVLAAFLTAGARPAEPGEFTQRAFLNGQMDLTQAEAVMDLIHAQSTLALRAANEQLSGAIGREAHALREPLVEILAHIEAYIDFPDEDISPDTGAALLQRLDGLRTAAQRLLATADHGRILRHGARTVIAGEPNVGKSSLLNRLAGFERAIVSSTAGTTRDTIEEFIQVHGIPLRLIDTAGLRESEDAIEQAGVSRTRDELDKADLILEVIDASQPPRPEQRLALPANAAARHLLILNKTDLGLHPDWFEQRSAPSTLQVSAETGEGLDRLRDAIRDLIRTGSTWSSDHPVAINTRHQACFQRALQHLEAARTALSSGQAPEFVALDLREALQALGEVIGHTDVEDILSVIFSSFCIGK